MKPKKPSLPKVWVMISEVVYPKPRIYAAGCSTSKAELPTSGGVIHLYAPVQKPKVCVWKLDAHSRTNGRTACGWWMDRDSTFTFCAECGGKIQVKGPR